MNRFFKGFLVAFRVIQLFLSLIVIAGGSFITYEFVSLASFARDLEKAIVALQDPAVRQKLRQTMGSLLADMNYSDEDVQKFVQILNTIFVPILRYFQSTPIRAIIITFAGVWSTSVIIYMFCAQRATSKVYLNKRSVRITLEVITLIIWLACIISASMLAAQYGFLALTGGVPTKIAYRAIKPLLQEALDKLIKAPDVIESLSMLNCFVSIGALSILTIAASIICMMVSLLSLLMACCISGKQQPHKQPKAKRPEATPGCEAIQTFLPIVPEKVAGYSVNEVSSPYVYESPVTPATPQTYDYYGQQCYSSHHNSTQDQYSGTYRVV